MLEKYSNDAFLCYSSRDRKVAENVARRLRNEGLRVFFDQWDLIPGRPWQEQLEAALLDSRVCVILVGEDKLGPWQTEEMRISLDMLVREKPRRVIPVMLPGSSEESLPAFLRRLAWVDSRDGLTDGWLGLIAAIQDRPPGPEGTGAEIRVINTRDTVESEPVATHKVVDRPLALWREKLSFLLEQEAITPDPSQRFALRKQIEEAEAKIKMLSQQESLAR